MTHRRSHAERERAPRQGVCEKCGGMELMVQNSLFGKVDLSHVKRGDLKVTVKLDGLDGEERTAIFTESFEGTMPGAAASLDGHHAKDEHPHEHHDGGSGHQR